MLEIKFPRYLSYCDTRQAANSAIVALLAGSKLAAHTLQLTRGSKQLLPDIFPGVLHIERFNLRTDAATDILVEADSHLGAIAVPYALAIHEDFVVNCVEWLKTAGVTILAGGKPIKAWNMHESLFDSCGVSRPSLEEFHLLRHMRNTQVHAGGLVGAELSRSVTQLSSASTRSWQKLTGRAPVDLIANQRISFTVGDIIAAFAVTKRLGREVNRALQVGAPRSAWSAEVVHDFAPQTRAPRNSDQWMRLLRGWARTRYRAVNLTSSELDRAAIEAGCWTRPAGSVI